MASSESAVADWSASRPILWWAALGVFFTIVQLTVIGAWVFSDKFIAIDPGPDVLPQTSRIAMWGVALIFGGSGIFAVAWLLRSMLRGERFTTFQTLMVGLWTCTWQDPTLNALRPVAVYNSHYPNRGSWSELFPFWLSPNGSRNPEPVTFMSGLYIFMVPLWVMFSLQMMRAAKRIWPGLNPLQQMVCALVVVAAVQTLAEVVMIDVEIFAYGGAIHALTLFPGTPHQFPIYEAVFWAVGMIACAALVEWPDRDGLLAVERGLPQLALSMRSANILRSIAVAGFANLAIMFYYFAMALSALYADRWTETLPSYFQNGICGPGSGYACPAPERSVPTIHTAPDPALLPSG